MVADNDLLRETVAVCFNIEQRKYRSRVARYREGVLTPDDMPGYTFHLAAGEWYAVKTGDPE